VIVLIFVLFLVVVLFSFVSINQLISWDVLHRSRDWLGRLSLKWPLMSGATRLVYMVSKT